MKTVSYSQIMTYSICQQKWHYAYKRGLSPVFATKPMELGSAVHAGLAASFKGDTVENGVRAWAQGIIPGWTGSMATTPEIEDEEYFSPLSQYGTDLEEIETRAVQIANYFLPTFALDYEVYIDPEGPFVEHPIEMKISRTEKITGVVDLLVREKDTGYLFLMDFKVREKLVDYDSQDYDMQMALYQYILKASYGIDTLGSIIYQIRSAIPQKPSLNKPDKYGVQAMSRNASIMTDWLTYQEALHEAGLDPLDYLDMREKLAGREFNRQLKTYRDEYTAQCMMMNFLDIWKKIKYTRKPFRNISRMTCSGCYFSDLCMAEMLGHDTDWMMGKYTQREVNDNSTTITQPL